MKNLLSRLTVTHEGKRASTFDAHALAACLLALAFVALASPQARAQVRPADTRVRQQTQQQSAAQNASPSDEEKDDEESESLPRGEAVRARVTDPSAILRAARMIRVHSLSAFVSEREVEDSLRKRKEFQAWGMVITRNDSDADLVIEITRKLFTRRFTFTVLDPRTMEVVTSGKMRSVLFGKHIPNKVAEKFANRVRVVRPYTPEGGKQ